VVAAPGKIPRASADRVKTDRRDAEHLARLLLAGGLQPVRVPGEAEEALRDLVGAREDVRGDLMRARHRLSKLLCATGCAMWALAGAERHRAWLASVELGEDAAQATLCDYRGAIETLSLRRAELERMIEAAIPTSPWAREVARLRCLRGIDALSAIGLCVEIGDFRRLASTAP
jgi:transposase